MTHPSVLTVHDDLFLHMLESVERGLRPTALVCAHKKGSGVLAVSDRNSVTDTLVLPQIQILEGEFEQPLNTAMRLLSDELGIPRDFVGTPIYLGSFSRQFANPKERNGLSGKAFSAFKVAILDDAPDAVVVNKQHFVSCKYLSTSQLRERIAAASAQKKLFTEAVLDKAFQNGNSF